MRDAGWFTPHGCGHYTVIILLDILLAVFYTLLGTLLLTAAYLACVAVGYGWILLMPGSANGHDPLYVWLVAPFLGLVTLIVTALLIASCVSCGVCCGYSIDPAITTQEFTRV